MKTVLAPIDLSEAAAGVISQAGALAGDVAGRVLLLHVVPPPAVINEYAPQAERLEGTGVDAEIAVLHGAPVATILGEAARANADYIVMGSHGHGALYHFFVGGTAGGVIQKSPCPVVVVPSQKAQPHPSASRPKPT